MYEGIQVQIDDRTIHIPEVLPLADITGEKIAERGVRKTQVYGKPADIWGGLGKRLEGTLQHKWILVLVDEVDSEGTQGWKRHAQKVFDFS